MNYLAHIFLSGTDEAVVIGNFIGDYVKGSDYKKFPENIQKGLILHRHIDTFTDTHPIVSQSKKYMALKYNKFAGIIIDIVYDHFLIQNWDRYCPVPLSDYKQDIFDVLQKYYPVLPERVQYFVPSFIKNDWIKAYSTQEGVVNILHRMSLRTILPDESAFASEILRKYYIQLNSEFQTFFPELIRYVSQNHDVRLPLVNNDLLKG